MTDNIEDIIGSITPTQVLVSILQETGKISVPVLSFLEADITNKELVIDYDGDSPAFVFSLRSKDE
jgi:hypothetical protein